MRDYGNFRVCENTYELRVVETYDFQIVGNAYALRYRVAVQCVCKHVIGAKRAVERAEFARETVGYERVVIRKAEFVVGLEQLVFNSAVIAVFGKTAITVMPCKTRVGERAGDVQKAGAPFVYEPFGGKSPSLEIIRRDEGDALQNSVECNELKGNVLVMLYIESVGANDKTVYALPVEYAYVFPLEFGVGVTVAKEQTLVSDTALPFHLTYKSAVKHGTRVGNQNSYNIGLTALKRAGYAVGLVIELLHRFVYLLACVFADVAAIVEHARYGGGSNAGYTCYVFDT